MLRKQCYFEVAGRYSQYRGIGYKDEFIGKTLRTWERRRHEMTMKIIDELTSNNRAQQEERALNWDTLLGTK